MNLNWKGRFTFFLGRNGEFKCSGLRIFQSLSKSIILMPVTSRGKNGRAYLEVPTDNIDDLIALLKEAKKLDEQVNYNETHSE